MSRIYIQNVTKSRQRSRPWPSNRGSPLEQNGFLSILHPIQRLILLNMSSLNFPVETLRAEQNLPADAEHTLVLTPGTSRGRCLAPPLSSVTPASGQALGRRARPARHCRARLPPTTSTPLGAACSPASLGSRLTHLTPRPPINKRAGCVSLQGIQPSDMGLFGCLVIYYPL